MNINSISNFSEKQINTTLSLLPEEQIKIQELMKQISFGLSPEGQKADEHYLEKFCIFQLKTGIHKPAILINAPKEKIHTQSLLQRHIALDFDQRSEEAIDYLLLRSIYVIDQKEALANKENRAVKLACFVGCVFFTGLMLHGFILTCSCLYIMLKQKETLFLLTTILTLITGFSANIAQKSLDVALFGLSKDLSKEQYLEIEDKCVALLGKQKVLQALDELKQVEVSGNEPSPLQRIAYIQQETVK